MRLRPHLTRRAIVAAAASATLSTPSPSDAAPAQTHEARAAALLDHAAIIKPMGRGPFPLVIQMHGCGGCKPFQRRYGERLAARGVAAIVLDSFGHRQIGRLEAYATVCTGLRLRGAARAGDLFAMVQWASGQPWVAKDAITAAGWSHGGWAVMDALAMPRDDIARLTGLTNLPDEPLADLYAAFLVYPYCGVASLTPRYGWRRFPRTAAVLGGRDSVVGAVRPRAVLETLARASDGEFDILFAQDATHAFDEPEAHDMRVRFDPALTDQTTDRLIRLSSGQPLSPDR